MKTGKLLFTLMLLVASLGQAQFKQPYVWSQSVQGEQLVVEVAIPKTAYLHAEQMAVELVPDVPAQEMSSAHPHTDDFGTADIYEGGQSHRWVYVIDPQTRYRITVKYQGCGIPEGGSPVCYAPATEVFVVGQASSVEAPVVSQQIVGTLDDLLSPPWEPRWLWQNIRPLKVAARSKAASRLQNARSVASTRGRSVVNPLALHPKNNAGKPRGGIPSGWVSTEKST